MCFVLRTCDKLILRISFKKKIILRIVIDTSPYLRKLLADYFWLVINSNRICKKKKKLQSGCRRRNQLLQVLSRPLITPPRPESAVRSLPLSREEPLQGLEEAFAPPRRPSRVSASTMLSPSSDPPMDLEKGAAWPAATKAVEELSECTCTATSLVRLLLFFRLLVSFLVLDQYASRPV